VRAHRQGSAIEGVYARHEQPNPNFLNLWSIAVYAIVVANSYVVATRLTAESSYELATLRAFLES